MLSTMKRTSLADQPCSIARTLDVAGEWWTPLILRDVAYGIRRFTEIQADLGISANVLADRLDALVGNGLLETRNYQQRPTRYEYLLTEKGADLIPALLALMQWGDRWAWAGKTGPVGVSHERCGHEIHIEIRCPHCDAAVQPDELRAKLRTPSGPDAGANTPTPDQPGSISAQRLLTSPDGIQLNA
jgi:DNA-binding HxlR family transcriptional regulator